MHDQHLFHHWLVALLAPAASIAVGCDLESQANLDDFTEHDDFRDEEPTGPAEGTPPEPADGATPVGFDTERQLYVYDADGDSFPDVTEQRFGTDFLDPSSNPGPGEPLFPTGICRPGYVQAGARLCISQVVQNAASYAIATSNCRNLRGQVCSYEDLTYLYLNSNLDANYNPQGRWLGNMVADDTVFRGNANVTFDNDPDIYNFENTANKGNLRNYWCCHDDE